MRAPDPIAFVFGATGYAGAALVEQLCRDDRVDRVIAHIRPDSASVERITERFRAGPAARAEIDRTPLEPDAFTHTLANRAPSHVFLCHGTTWKRARAEGQKDPYETVDVGLTKLVCDATVAAGIEPRIVQLSSIGAGRGPRNNYLAARGRAEAVVKSSGLPFTICRAPLMTGPDRVERRGLETVARLLGDPFYRVLGALGMRRFAARSISMTANDVAEGLARSAFHYQTINRIVHPDELRREGVYEREPWVPESRRDTPRH